MIHEIKELVHETRELPFLIEEVEAWRNEMNDILNEVYNPLSEKEKILRDSAHEELMRALNEAERLKHCLQGNISILNLCAAFINTGKVNELAKILTPPNPVPDMAVGTEQKPEGEQKNTTMEQETVEHLEIKAFKVLEAKKKPDGETRAWCQMPDGNKVAVFSEGEVSETFLTSKGKEVKAWCSSSGKDYRAKKLA